MLGTPPIERTGNLVSVTITYTDEVPGLTARAKPKLKKVPRTKSDHVNLVDLDRMGFARACLAVHDLEHEYDLTLPRGPDYLFWPERYSYVSPFSLLCRFEYTPLSPFYPAVARVQLLSSQRTMIMR